MFMKRLKELQQVLDEADPYLFEAYTQYTDERLLEIKQTEMRFRDIAINRNKPLTEIDKRVTLLDSILEYRLLQKALKDHDDLLDSQKGAVGGVTLV